MKKISLAIGILTVFLANTASGSGQITACASIKDGKMRVVDNANMCSAKEYVLVWNVAGEQGEQGLQGEQGPQGEQGIAGTSGLPSVYDGDGNLLGSLLGEFHQSGGSTETTPSGYTILSTKGYIYPLDTRLGTVHLGQSTNSSYAQGQGLRRTKIFYSNWECSGGQTYILGHQEYLPGSYKTSFPVRTVFYDEEGKTGDPIWVSGEHLIASEELKLYELNNGSCNNSSVFDSNIYSTQYLEALPNDPNITGIPNEAVALPISYE